MWRFALCLLFRSELFCIDTITGTAQLIKSRTSRSTSKKKNNPPPFVCFPHHCMPTMSRRPVRIRWNGSFSIELVDLVKHYKAQRFGLGPVAYRGSPAPGGQCLDRRPPPTHLELAPPPPCHIGLGARSALPPRLVNPVSAPGEKIDKQKKKEKKGFSTKK